MIYIRSGRCCSWAVDARMHVGAVRLPAECYLCCCSCMTGWVCPAQSTLQVAGWLPLAEMHWPLAGRQSAISFWVASLVSPAAVIYMLMARQLCCRGVEPQLVPSFWWQPPELRPGLVICCYTTAVIQGSWRGCIRACPWSRTCCITQFACCNIGREIPCSLSVGWLCIDCRMR